MTEPSFTVTGRRPGRRKRLSPARKLTLMLTRGQACSFARRRRSDLAILLALLLLVSLPAARAQQLPAPAEPPQAGANEATTLKVTTSNVLVPTLVEKKNGEVIYGLTGDSFSVTDNGVPQKIHVDDDLDTTPVSLVVCLERGRSSGLQFDKFARLAPLVEQFLGTGNGEVALVEFDSQTIYEEAFTHDTSLLDRDLSELRPGDGGAAILDAVGTSIDLLEHRPPERRRILLLISESRDHGSKNVSPAQLVERIGTSNTLVLSLTWSPVKAEFLDQLTQGGGGGLVSLAVLAANAMRSNVSKSLAVMSGGEYMSFTRQKGFEERISEMASHARNRYILSFRPTDQTSGLHSIQVRLLADVDARVVARTDYWSTPAAP